MSALHILSQISTFRLNKESTAGCCSSSATLNCCSLRLIEIFTVLALEKDSLEIKIKNTLIGFLSAVEMTLSDPFTDPDPKLWMTELQLTILHSYCNLSKSATDGTTMAPRFQDYH